MEKFCRDLNKMLKTKCECGIIAKGLNKSSTKNIFYYINSKSILAKLNKRKT
jgi:hypothetical protein